jgi:hypothetical protein
MVRVKIYVEGGADNKNLDSECRRGFAEFFEKAGLEGKKPRVSPCGSRKEAFDDFCTALSICGDDEIPILLVDSEGPVTSPINKPWQHLRDRVGDEWHKPVGATDEQAHLMVQCMETWFIADKETLANFYQQNFKEHALPVRTNIEEIPKNDLLNSLKRATKDTQKGEYSKGDHSFKILAIIDPQKVIANSDHAKRLIDTLRTI